MVAAHGRGAAAGYGSELPHEGKDPVEHLGPDCGEQRVFTKGLVHGDGRMTNIRAVENRFGLQDIIKQKLRRGNQLTPNKQAFQLNPAVLVSSQELHSHGARWLDMQLASIVNYGGTRARGARRLAKGNSSPTPFYPAKTPPLGP